MRTAPRLKASATRPGRRYQLTSNAFDALGAEAFFSEMQSMAQAAQTEFSEAMNELSDLIREAHPVGLLSELAFYGLTSIVEESGTIVAVGPIEQAHVELVQALALQHVYDFDSTPSYAPHDMGRAAELAERASQAFILKRLASPEPITSADQFARRQAIEDMRLHTQTARGWAYPYQAKNLITELFRPLDDDIKHEAGIRIEHLVEMCFRLIARSTDLHNAYRDALGAIFRAKTLESMVELFCRQFHDQCESETNLLTAIRGSDLRLKDAKLYLMQQASQTLGFLYLLNTEMAVDAYAASARPDDIRDVLHLWSHEFGDLAEGVPEHFFMSNPVWVRPIVRLEDDVWFWPVLNTAMSFMLELMESVVRERTLLWDKYEVQRGRFLEDIAESLFREAFPSAQVVRGPIWTDPETGQEFENDVLVVFDTVAVVVEAKSGRISAPARRGADLRLGTEVAELIAEASHQSARFTTFLQTHPGAHRFRTKSGRQMEVDTSAVSRVLRVSVTLDWFGALQSRLLGLQEAGLLTSAVTAVPTLSVADLEICFRLLDGPLQRLHYLIRRQDFELHTMYRAHETDLLAFYLDTGFNIGPAEYDQKLIMLDGLSKNLDPYFMAEATGADVSKPSLELTNWWRAILRRVESEPSPGWTEIGMTLLNVALEDQRKVENRFKRVKKTVRGHGYKPGKHECLIALYTGSEQRRELIVAVAFKNQPREQRNSWIAASIGHLLENDGLPRALVIGVDVEQDDYPYTVLAWVVTNRDSEPQQA